MAHDRAYSRFTKVEVGTLIVNDAVTFPGGAGSITGDQTISGNIIFTAASAKLIPGATSFLIRNNADSASNLSITNAGVVSLLGTAATAQLIITSTNAAAFAVGRLGATTPALVVDSNTATSITGIKIKSAATGNGVAVSAIGEASNGNLTIDAQGSGTLSLNVTATGNIVLGRAATGVSLSVTGAVTTNNATAVAAPSGAAAAFLTSTTALLGIWFVSATPNAQLTAAKGSLALATNGSSASTRAFINSDGASAWVAVTTAS